MRRFVVVSAALSSALLVFTGSAIAASGWAAKSSPHPGVLSSLSAVSCNSGGCLAVGYYDNSSYSGVDLALHWNGSSSSSWQVVTAPSPTGSDSFAGVSCLSGGCMVVGTSIQKNGAEQPLGYWWNGSKWTTDAPQNVTGFTGLAAVSCSSADACTAVGSIGAGGGNPKTLIERWNGTSWKVQPSPNPGLTTGNDEGPMLFGVACPTATYCLAVGYYDSGNGQTARQVTLVESWNGKQWKVVSSPNPAGNEEQVLSAVACAPQSTTSCMAVGSSGTSSGGYVTLAEHWTGSSWTLQSTPNVSGGTEYSGNQLFGVSCPTTTACTAVGSYANLTSTTSSYGTLAERWSGSAWASQSTPNASADNPSALSGVDCPSLADCTAVGYYGNFPDEAVTPTGRTAGPAVKRATSSAESARTLIDQYS